MRPTATVHLEAPRAVLPACPVTLERNLAALDRRSPGAAHAVRAAPPRSDVEFAPTDEGPLAGALDGRWLCSRRAPGAEAARLAETVDLHSAGAIAVLGFGAGHHVRALSERAGPAALVIVFEPDVGLLRAVLERIDCSAWLARGNVAVVTDPADRGAVTRAAEGAEALLAMGVKVLSHPPSAARLGAAGTQFSQTLAGAVASLRAQIVTTMVQSEVTIRNALLNAEHYVARPGVDDLAGRCAGFPAVVVSAGPSLRRNAHLLAEPGVRDRCVIVATQTTLKPLLALGVRPHFVCALDYHEISRRFYEGLTPEALEGVTLVAEAKANPAILDAFPGAFRCPGDPTLDLALADALPGPRGALRAGATVAHLSYYLARHLGCDPVALIGQDLAFTDGQYYAAGAAIHSVWAGELNPFNTLEMMEWQRIVRGRATLRVARDHLGRRVYTDEQMHAYLAQFERDFADDARRGLSVVDATEGGVEKRHARAEPLAGFLARCVEGAPALPDLSCPGTDERAARAGRQRAAERLRELRAAAGRLVEVSRRTSDVLERMPAVMDDPRRLNPLIEEAHRLRDQAEALEPAYTLVHRLNQAGGFNRIRADRAIHLDRDLPERDLQRRRAQRDARNVRWFADAADALREALDDALAALAGAPKPTRLPSPPEEESLRIVREDGQRTPPPRRRVVALVAVDGAHPACLGRTIDRLRRCASLDSIALLATDPERARTALALHALEHAQGLPVEAISIDGPALAGRERSIRAARAFAPSCWRGGIGGLSVYDELVAPSVAAAALARLGADAALLVGADWPLLEPALCDAVIERHRERPADHRLAFTQAPPGLAGAVVSRDLLADLGASADRAGPIATIGGLLTYSPIRPAPDPIARPVCVPVAPAIRDSLGRFIGDTEERAAALLAAAEQIDAIAHRGGARDEAVARLLIDVQRTLAPCGPTHLTIGPHGGPLDSPAILARLEQLAGARPDAAVSIMLPGDPDTSWRALPELIHRAKTLSLAALHVRAGALSDPALLEACIDAGADVLSLDCSAARAETFARLTGADRFADAMRTLDRLLARRQIHAGLPSPWIVPRITRCDATYEDIEPFFDCWLLRAGWAVIDPPTPNLSGGRIEPLPLPPASATRWSLTEMTIDFRGAVVDDGGAQSGEPLLHAWARLLAARMRAPGAPLRSAAP